MLCKDYLESSDAIDKMWLVSKVLFGKLAIG